jgi:hypothetical protein
MTASKNPGLGESPMAKHPDDSATQKDYIIRHMNKDHHDALVNYLQFYARVTPREAATAELVDINLDGMIITRVTDPNGPPRPIVVPINPRMDSLKQSRERLVAMAFESLEGLGRSRWKIESYPNISLPGLLYGAFTATILALVLFPNETLRPGAQARQFLLLDSEKVARWLFVHQRELRSVIMGSAVYTAAMPMRRRLQRHCYKSSWGQWIAWFSAALFEGVFACGAFDEKVRAAEAQISNRKL